MCINSKYIWNPYICKRILVPCGHCEACKQAKAQSRARRIRNHERDGYIALFVTLTYSNKFIPYVRRSDIQTINKELHFEDVFVPPCRYDLKSAFQWLSNTTFKLPVYRDGVARYYRGEPKEKSRQRIIGEYSLDDLSSLLMNYKDIRYPRHKFKDAIGVCYYPDLQNFLKRLRINLKRYYGYKDPISYYSCSEYGPCSDRPHFHLLIYCKADSFEILQSAIDKSWPYHDRNRQYHCVEIAENAAAYCASYVNSTNSRVKCFEASPFRQKHSYSQGFGTLQECFSLSSILEKVQSGSLTYSFKTAKDRVPCDVTIPIPKYVISRYFPKFKGFSLLAPDEVRELLFVPKELVSRINYRAAQLYRSRGVPDKLSHMILYYDTDSLNALVTRFRNIYELFHRELGWSWNHFLIYYPKLYVDVWSAYSSTVLKFSFDEVHSIDDLYDHYENIADCIPSFDVDVLTGEIVDSSRVKTDLFDKLDFSRFQLNPNARKSVVNRHFRLLYTYHLKDKNRKVVNHCYSNSGFDV